MTLLVVGLLTCACSPAPTSRPETSAAPSEASAAPASSTAPLTSPAPAASLPPTASASASGAPTAADWPGYHGGAGASGAVNGFPAPASPAVAWSAALDGAVYGQPLVVAGTVIAATEGDSVYGIDPKDGAVLWRTHLGTPVPLSALPCGNIDPLGITGAPAYDSATASVFVVTEETGPRHVLYALDPADGAVRWSRNVDVGGDDPRTHQQREALAVADGRVYIGFGGLYGDCGQYRGKLVGVPVTGQGATIAYIVPVAREGAIWSGGGAPAVDSAGNLYVATGNGSSATVYDGSDSVLELSPDLRLLSRFAPSSWASDNASDADLGSMSPALLPGGWVVIAGKSANGYVLRQGGLGGIGGQVSTRPVCTGFGGAASVGSVVYLPCSDGVREITVDDTGQIRLVWRTATGAGGPPVVGGGAVWAVNVDSGVLFALSAAAGRTLAQVPLGEVPHFASPSLWGGLVLVGTMRGVTAVRAA